MFALLRTKSSLGFPKPEILTAESVAGRDWESQVRAAGYSVMMSL